LPKINKKEALDTAEVEIAKEALILLVAVIAIVAVVSVWGIYNVSHNFRGSIYYTISSLIDVNNEGFATAIMAPLTAFSGAFDEIVAIELLDGIVKVMLIGFIVAVFIDALTKVDINSKLNSLRRGRLDGHVILCGYSGLGEQIVDQLSDKKKAVVIIEKNPTRLEEVNERGYMAFDGDFTEMSVLKKAGAEKARAIIFCAETDITNLMGILAARRLNKDVTIISRGREEFSVTKMQRAGADLCIIPELVAGLELGAKLAGI
jgi:voltage-gated potassium channel